jgi:hypothetical protein
MAWPKILYYGVLCIALIMSFRTIKYSRYILFIPLIAFSLIIELAREYLVHESPIDKATLLLIVMVEYSLLSLIISNFIQSKMKRKMIIYSNFLMIPLFIILQLFVVSVNESYRFLNQMIAGPLICAWTILYLFDTAKHDEEFAITRSPMFWISLGNLLFYSGSFFSYGFGPYLLLKGNKDVAEAIFWIARILNILLYILYAIGFLCLKSTKQYSLR